MAAVFIPLGAILIAFAAGAALNPPTSDTIIYNIAATNTGTKPIDNVRIHDSAIDELGGTLDCPGTSLEPGEQIFCSAEVTGAADLAHASRVTTGVLVGTAALTMGVLVRRFPKRTNKTPGEPSGEKAE